MYQIFYEKHFSSYYEFKYSIVEVIPAVMEVESALIAVQIWFVYSDVNGFSDSLFSSIQLSIEDFHIV